MEKKYRLTTESMCIWNRELYFVPRECPVICKWDFKSETYEILSEIPDENALCERLFNGMCILDGKVVLVPYNAEKIWIFEISEKTWDSISLNNLSSNELGARYVGGKTVGNYAYMFGYESRNILRIDPRISSAQIVKILDSGVNNAFWGQSVALKNDVIFVANLKDQRICRINTIDNKAEYIDVKKKPGANCGADYFENSLYIAPYKGNKLYKINNSVVKEVILPDEYECEKNIFNGIVSSKDTVLLYSPYDKSLIIRNINSEYSFEKVGFIRYAIFDEEIGFIVSKKGRIEIFDHNMNLKNSLDAEIDEKEYIDIVGRDGLKCGLYQENENFGLGELLTVMMKLG
jgi:hypothetical protein